MAREWSKCLEFLYKFEDWIDSLPKASSKGRLCAQVISYTRKEPVCERSHHACISLHVCLIEGLMGWWLLRLTFITNNGAWHFHKPLFGSSVATCRLACSEISLSINQKNAREKSRKRSDLLHNLPDGLTALAQLYALNSHRARSFNQWQHALYPNFIINFFEPRTGSSILWAPKFVFRCKD